ncbi:hypothetical protein [Synechococcus sp. PCC 6312]|uniref:hypothetical protein n=1 Tax=Synechococcus sp. (strain ATCC 27167 / PCC 6312) TaxID=195253 RepID=UPI00029EE591|nr:hypothetical protein [Synechococcus sp. PCC 6312]AFY59754.1 hypothetical protein Syn6312_0528 [Synechococcus sp. PCC 6312]
MSNPNPVELVQKSYYAAIGAVSSVVESVQDSQKRDATLAQVQQLITNPSSDKIHAVAKTLAEKGQVTEQQARKFVDTILDNRSVPTTAKPASSTTQQLQAELIALTQTLANLRGQLETPASP